MHSLLINVWKFDIQSRIKKIYVFLISLSFNWQLIFFFLWNVKMFLEQLNWDARWLKKSKKYAWMKVIYFGLHSFNYLFSRQIIIIIRLILYRRTCSYVTDNEKRKHCSVRSIPNEAFKQLDLITFIRISKMQCAFLCTSFKLLKRIALATNEAKKREIRK